MTQGATPLPGFAAISVATGAGGVQLMAGRLREDLLLAAAGVLAPAAVAPVDPKPVDPAP